jgi:hypothetical protein
MATLPQLVREISSEALSLALILSEAQEVQWKAAPVPKPREDTTERSSGGHSDPTALAAVDDRRLAVREAVDAAERELVSAVEKMGDARAELARAVAHWHGEQ